MYHVSRATRLHAYFHRMVYARKIIKNLKKKNENGNRFTYLLVRVRVQLLCNYGFIIITFNFAEIIIFRFRHVALILPTT